MPPSCSSSAPAVPGPSAGRSSKRPRSERPVPLRPYPTDAIPSAGRPMEGRIAAVRARVGPRRGSAVPPGRRCGSGGDTVPNSRSARPPPRPRPSPVRIPVLNVPPGRDFQRPDRSAAPNGETHRDRHEHLRTAPPHSTPLSDLLAHVAGGPSSLLFRSLPQGRPEPLALRRLCHSGRRSCRRRIRRPARHPLSADRAEADGGTRADPQPVPRPRTAQGRPPSSPIRRRRPLDFESRIKSQLSAPRLWTSPPPTHYNPATSGPDRHGPGHGAQVAQLVEQRIENPRVGGSTPSLGTITPNLSFAFKSLESIFVSPADSLEIGGTEGAGCERSCGFRLPSRPIGRTGPAASRMPAGAPAAVAETGRQSVNRPAGRTPPGAATR